MGGVLSGGLSLASVACQSAICCCNVATCCMSAGNGVGGISIRAAKAFYILVLGLATLLALFLRYNGDTMSLNLGAWEMHCSSDDDEHDIGPSIAGYSASATAHYVYCKGDAAVYRISFVLAMFFGVHAVLSLTGKAFHRGYWGLKLVALFFGLALCFFIPNSFFDNSGFAWIARVVSMLFLALQVLILIDFAYEWNDLWVGYAFNGDEENSMWLIAILSSAAILYLVSLVGIPLLFTFYECTEGVVFSSFTLVGIIAFTIITLFRDKIVGMEGAILPAATVAAYTTYLCWSALESNPDESCRPTSLNAEGKQTSNETVNMIIGAIIASVSLMWTSYSMTSSLQGLVSGATDDDGKPNASTPLYTVESSEGGEAMVSQDSYETADDSDGEGENLWIFHLVMCTASMYMAMLLTNWGASSDSVHGNEDGKVGLASMWVKIISQWFTIALYIWTLVAPAVLQDRDWDF